MSESEHFVSVVAPLHTGVRVTEFVSQLSALLAEHYRQFEIVLVDDGCDEALVQSVSLLLDQFRHVRLIRLTRKFGFETALLAGLESVIGDYVVVMRPDYDPPERIPEMVQQAARGFDIVTGVQAHPERDSWFALRASRLFYWYANRVLRLDLPLHSTDFRVLSRRAVSAFIRIKDRMRHFRMYGAFVGFRSITFPYEPLSSGATQQRSLRERIALSVGVIVANSVQPLRLVSLLGLFAAILNVCYAFYVVLVYLFRDDVAPGWVTLSMTSSAMFFLLFLTIAVISEYLGRILLETRDRPQYYVLEELNSRVVLDGDEQRNVVRNSTGSPDNG